MDLSTKMMIDLKEKWLTIVSHFPMQSNLPYIIIYDYYNN